MLSFKPTLVLFLLLFSYCTGIDLIDDYVPAVIRITSPIKTLPLGRSITFEATYFNNVGMPILDAPIIWISSDPEILSVNAQGQGNPLKEGSVSITAQIVTEEGTTLSDKLTIAITSNVILEEMVEEPQVEEPQEETTSLSPTLEILNRITEISAETSYQFEISYKDEMGNAVNPSELTWISSDESVIKIASDGTISALNAGTATITVSLVHSNTILLDQNVVRVNALESVESTSFQGKLATKSGYTLEGSFTFSKTEDGLLLALGDDYKASSTLPGLYVYLSNNNNTTAQAYEIAAVKIFSGAHSYLLPSSIGLKYYQYILYWCKPFNVKVGEAKIYEK